MPKLLHDLKSTILAEAKRQVMRDGYAGMTLRSVAAGCGIAVGTIYNYFASKDTLIACFMLEDWMDSFEEMKKNCADAVLPADVFACVYRGIMDYSCKYEKLFGDTEAKKSADGVFAVRHAQLRAQIASLITETCRRYALHDTAYLPEFIAEAILSHASERGEFSLLSEILIQLFQKTPYGTEPLHHK